MCSWCSTGKSEVDILNTVAEGANGFPDVVLDCLLSAGDVRWRRIVRDCREPTYARECTPGERSGEGGLNWYKNREVEI